MQIPKIEESTFKFLDAEFTIKELLSGDLARIKDKTMGVVVSLDRVGDEIVPNQSISPEMELSNSLKIQKSLVGWKNVTGSDGKEMKCDTKGKREFCENLPEETFTAFSEKFKDESDKLKKALKEQREKAVKN